MTDAQITALLDAMTTEEKVGSLLVARVVTGAGGELWDGRDDESPSASSPRVSSFAISTSPT